MELDDFKAAWLQHDKKLDESLRLNESLLKKINLGRSKKEMDTTLTYEWCNCVGCIFLFAYILYVTIKHSNDGLFLSSGLASAFLGGIYIYFSVVKIKLLSHLEFYHSPVIELQKAVQLFKTKYLKFKKYEIGLIPFSAVIIVPVLAKELRNIDVFNDVLMYAGVVVIAIVFSYSASAWVYRYLYDMKLKNASAFLDELRLYEKEG